VPIVKKAQQNKNSQIRLFFNVVMSSRRLKLASAALGELRGRRAWAKAFSLPDSQDAVEGTVGQSAMINTEKQDDEQSGKKKYVKIPRSTVKIPSVKMSLRSAVS